MIMNKLLCVVLLAVSGVASADGPGGFRHYERGYYERPYRTGGDWVGPALIGGIIGYELSRPRYDNPPPVVVQRPVIVQQPTIVYPPVSAPPYPPAGFHYEQMLDGYCNCYRTVLVQN
jgi:hypothetical protein